jgi:CrcB protein
MTDERRVLLAVFAGGVAGTLARVALTETWTPEPGHWPWATFLVNIVGAALIGWVMGRERDRGPISVYRHPLFGTGVCGALTTFSTLQLELLHMLDAGEAGLALGYIGASLALGLLAVRATTALARRPHSGAPA